MGKICLPEMDRYNYKRNLRRRDLRAARWHPDPPSTGFKA
jgi:hypothetical protein